MSISAISQSQTSAASISGPTAQNIIDNVSDPQNWLYLIPTIGTLAIGILFAPHFAIGLGIGAAMACAKIPIALALRALGVLKKEERDSEYEKSILSFPLLGTLIAPIVEEGFFRGVLQPLATRTMIWLVPAAAATAFFGTGLSIATAVTIVATATLFGLAHLSNPHKNSHIQAIITGVDGIVFGVLAAQFGLGASIAAHIAGNTLLITIGKIFHKNSETASSSGVQSR
jgi:membrane protease YdiL (CAAX protease family)